MQVLRAQYATRVVAIKLLHIGLVEDQYFRVNFRRELKELRSQHHAHVLSFIGAGEWEDGRLFLATEYCEKGDLCQLLANKSVELHFGDVHRFAVEIADVRNGIGAV